MYIEGTEKIKLLREIFNIFSGFNIDIKSVNTINKDKDKKRCIIHLKFKVDNFDTVNMLYDKIEGLDLVKKVKRE